MPHYKSTNQQDFLLSFFKNHSSNTREVNGFILHKNYKPSEYVTIYTKESWEKSQYIFENIIKPNREIKKKNLSVEKEIEYRIKNMKKSSWSFE